MYGFCVKESPKWAIPLAFARNGMLLLTWTLLHQGDNLFFAKAQLLPVARDSNDTLIPL